MATFQFIGGATAVAQTVTVQVTSFDAATDYSITAGDATATVAGNSSANQTATELAAAWNALTHAHATGISAGATTDTVTLVADTPGVEFTATSAVDGGNGTIGNATTTVANAGPADASTLANWLNTSTGAIATALPGGSDVALFTSGSAHCVFGLAALTGGPDIIVDASYTGRIGKSPHAFITSADGATEITTAREYRATHLSGPFGDVQIGRFAGFGTSTGSGRVNIQTTGTAACVHRVQRTASTATNTGQPVVDLMPSDGNHSVYVESAAGGVGIARAVPGATATVGTVLVSDDSTASKLVVGAGTTLTTLTTYGGVSVVEGAAANVTTVYALGGQMTLTGDFTVANLTVDGATVYDAHTKAAGNASTTVNLRSGTLDWQVSGEPRSQGTLNHTGGTLLDSNAVTVTTRNEPPRRTVTA